MGGAGLTRPARSAPWDIVFLDRDGTIKAPKIDRIMPLAEAAEAHRLIERREVTGKLLLEVTDAG